MIELFKAHEGLAESVHGKERLGMFYSALGIALHSREQLTESYTYLRKSLELGEETKSPESDRVCLLPACYDLCEPWLPGRSRQIRGTGSGPVRRSQGRPASSQGCHWIDLQPTCTEEISGSCVNWGRNSWMREGRDQTPGCLAMGEMASRTAHLSAGDFQSAIESFKSALQASIDPLLIQGSTFFLGFAYLANGQYQEALSMSQEVMRFSDKYGAEFMGTPALSFMGYALVATGDLDRGLELARESRRDLS